MHSRKAVYNSCVLINPRLCELVTVIQQQAPVVDCLKLVLLTQVVDNCHSVCSALLTSDYTPSLTSILSLLYIS